MTHWLGKQPSESNLRLFDPSIGWKQYADQKDDDGKVTHTGAGRVIENLLSTALNASNLLLLTGAGSSHCAKNPTDQRQAPSMTDLWDAVETAATPAVMTDIVSLIPTANAVGKNVEKLLTLCKLYVTLFSDGNADTIAAFIKTAEKAILLRIDFVTDETNIDTHKLVVRKMARRGIRKQRARLFTTNYDLCFEKAAQQQQFVVIDGFSHSSPQSYDRAHFSYDIVRRGDPNEPPDYIENVFHLYKLHGSLDWKRRGTTIIRSKDAAAGSPVLIFPRDSKYQETFDSPYLDMMGALQSALRVPDTALIVSGFGFNDDHIANPIIAAIEANMSLHVVICDVAFLSDEALAGDDIVVPKGAAIRSDNKYWQRLKALVSAGDRRITLINGRFEDLAFAMPELAAQTDRERHIARVHLVAEDAPTGASA